MGKGHVADARIECPCCLPHLTIMLSGVPGMTTPTTDDLVLIYEYHTSVLVLASPFPGCLLTSVSFGYPVPLGLRPSCVRP